MEEILSTIPDFDEDKMYPFYEKDVHSKDDIYAYLKTWFQKDYQHDVKITYQDDTYVLIAGFRRGFVSHCVFCEPNKHLFVFAVGDDGTDYDFLVYGGKYKSYEDLLQGTSEFYAHLWKMSP